MVATETAQSAPPVAPAPARPMLKDPELKRALQELRRTDNVTNWFHIGRAYLVGAVAIGAAVAFHQHTTAAGWHWLWSAPVFLLSILVVGATQHQLAGAGHEATHYVLFRNRVLNDLASDWLCMFPILTATHVFRQFHLCHHQFINDPKRDPDFAQLNDAGQWLGFPVSKRRFLLALLRQVTLVPLVRYVLVRAKTNSLGAFNNAYADPSKSASQWPNRVLLGFIAASVCGQVTVAYTAESAWAALLVPAIILPVGTALLLMIPRARYSASKLIPPVSSRANMIGNLVFLALLHGTLTAVQILTEAPVWVYTGLLWVVPLLTTFPLCMVLRQLVQHGNGDRGWLTNTRTFLVHPFIRYAVFPFGMDYHLPHHMFCTVPHFNLPKLHAFLARYPDYTTEGLVVEGYFFPPRSGPDRNPTVLEVLGPDYHKSSAEVFIDDDATALAENREPAAAPVGSVGES
jgi:fatty acid desaturase